MKNNEQQYVGEKQRELVDIYHRDRNVGSPSRA
jgi:hypothetical protein